MANHVIKSSENFTFKIFGKLYANKAFRKELGQCLLDGPHLINSFISAGGEILELIRDTTINSEEVNAIVSRYPKVKVHTLEHDLFTKISELISVSGVIALINIPITPLKKPSGLTLLLDNIQDPGNIGSILRSAAAVGSEAVFLSKGCSDVWSPKTLRGSQGAQFFIDCYEQQNLEDLIDKFDFPTYALSHNGESIYKNNFTRDIAFILGSEGQGVSINLLARANKTLTSPMMKNIESLNVSSAASIVMYEYYRQFQSVGRS